MSREDRIEEKPRELRLEGIGLVLIGGILIAVLVGVFFLGRWYERQFHSVPAALAENIDPLGRVPDAGLQEPSDLDQEATYFDRVEGREQELEPEREVNLPVLPESGRTESPPPAEPPARGGTPAAEAVADGKYFVQVFAGRDEGSAASLVSKLWAEGYPVKLHTVKEGQGSNLYKVRVGGYATEEIARGKSRELREGGYQGAWVTRVE